MENFFKKNKNYLLITNFFLQLILVKKDILNAFNIIIKIMKRKIKSQNIFILIPFKFLTKNLEHKDIYNFTTEMKNEEIEAINNHNFFGIYYSIIYENKLLDKKLFNNYYSILPLKYLFLFKNSIYIGFKIPNAIFKSAMIKS